MSSLIKIFVAISSFVLLSACNKDKIAPLVDPANVISFQIEQSNSSDDFISNAKNAVLKSKTSGWRLNDDGKTQLIREINFDLELENGRMVEFGFWFIKYEPNQDHLILLDQELYPGDRRWDYTSLEVEAKNYFQEFDEARVLINSNVIFHHVVNDNFEVVKIDEATVDAISKSYITIEFSGVAFGWYDSLGMYTVYKITNGTFKGVIE